MNARHQPLYFIGIALPSELDRVVSGVQWELHDNDARLMKPLLPHITLLNPPSLRGIMPEELLPRIHEIAERYLPLTIACQEVEFFKEAVCYIRVQSQGLYSLQSQLLKLLPEEVRTAHYKRPYTPHITLAQVHEPRTLDIEKLKRELPAKLTLPYQFTVDSVSYFQRIMPREYRAVKYPPQM